MTDRKVMRGAEMRRIRDDLVLIDRYPDGSAAAVTRPIGEWLLIADWICELAEDHDGAVAPEPGPSDSQQPETDTCAACTRTRGTRPARSAAGTCASCGRATSFLTDECCPDCWRRETFGFLSNDGRGVRS